jgi:hypothetical protein
MDRRRPLDHAIPRQSWVQFSAMSPAVAQRIAASDLRTLAGSWRRARGVMFKLNPLPINNNTRVGCSDFSRCLYGGSRQTAMALLPALF